MRPRVILKTHSGVRRPGIFSVLIARCSSATHPAYEENIIRKLVEEFQDVPREDLKGAKLGERGAAFHVVWMAKPQQLGLLTSNLFWSWKGQVIHMLTTCNANAEARAYLDLSPSEQMIYLKYYLEGDGAMVLGLARELLARGSLSETDLVHSDLLEQVLRGIWEEYLDLSTNITQRVELREKLERQRYDATTRRHKTYPHLVPLEDMGLIVRREHDNHDVFTAAVCGGRMPLQTLVERFPSIRDLEVIIERAELPAILADALFSGYRHFSEREDLASLMRTAFENYRKLKHSGTAIYALDAIADASYAQMLANQNVLVTRRHIDDLFRGLQAQYPQEVRFHVDRLGRPAYVIVADELVDQILSDRVHE